MQCNSTAAFNSLNDCEMLANIIFRIKEGCHHEPMLFVFSEIQLDDTQSKSFKVSDSCAEVTAAVTPVLEPKHVLALTSERAALIASKRTTHVHVNVATTTCFSAAWTL